MPQSAQVSAPSSAYFVDEPKPNQLPPCPVAPPSVLCYFSLNRVEGWVACVIYSLLTSMSFNFCPGISTWVIIFLF